MSIGRPDSVHALPVHDDSKTAPRRLRIAIFNRLFSATGGGAERYSIALVEQLAARHDIHVFAQQIDNRIPGVTFHKVSMPCRKPRWLNQFWYGLVTWWATRDGSGFDVIHSHESTWQGQVQTVHVLPVKYNLFHGRTGFRRAMRWLGVITSPRLQAYLGMEKSRFAWRADKRIIATSPFLKGIIETTFPASAPMIRIVTPGVHLPQAIPQAEARRSLSLPQEGRLVAFVANDYGKKGLGTLLGALLELPADIGLAVVGDPSYIPRFEQEATSLGVRERVHFLGYLTDVSVLYQACDALAHPTLEDTFAMVVLEAMAAGLPVVVSGVPYCGIAGLLHDGVDALLLVSPTDSAELARKLFSVLEPGQTRQTISEGARQFAAQWTWSAIARQQELIYYDVAAPAAQSAQGKRQALPQARKTD